MHNTYDPAKESGELEFHGCMSEHCAICGPSGNNTLIDHNEKGILESNLKKVTDSTRSAQLQKEGGHRWTI